MERTVERVITWKRWGGYFLAYAFIGWVIDSVFHSINAGAVVLGGFVKTTGLPIPLAPIYGFGGVLCGWLAEKFRYARVGILVLIIGMSLTLVEYTGGVISTLLFGHRIWDYSSYPFNLDGHIHLGNSICLAFVGTVMGRWVHPKLTRSLS